VDSYAITSSSLSRRRVVQGLFAVLLSPGFAPTAFAQANAEAVPIVRISRGSFPPEEYDSIKTLLDSSQTSLVPAIRQLSGCLHYFVAIDRESSTLINVSVWRSLADAKQMETLGPMIALAERFTREGVRFERPILNYETLWSI
jgi:hypothetical protein